MRNWISWKSSSARNLITDKRAKLAVEMQQTVLDDNAFVYCSFS